MRQGSVAAHRNRLRSAVVGALVVGLLSVGLVPVALADDLDDQRDRVAAQLAQSASDVDDSSDALAVAQNTVNQTAAELASAQAALAAAQADVTQAQEQDAQMAAALTTAQTDLATAVITEDAGQAKIDAKKDEIGQIARETYQQQSTLVGIASLISVQEPQQLGNRIQWTTTVLDSNQAELNSLADLQTSLAEAKTNRRVLEVQAEQAKQKAADHLAVTQAAQQRASDAADAVAAALSAANTAQAAAQAALVEDQQQYAALQAEQASVNARIAERARQAEIARQAELARQAAAAKAAAAAAAAAAKQSSSSTSKSSTTASRSTVTSSSTSSSSGLIHPLANHGPITSPYGMRVHPITHVYKMHDGTDWGASCGTPLRAPANGVVTEAYFNAGYGNRLFIDLGYVDGAQITVSLNHLSRYAVSTGAHVTRGQIVGYVGATGYATGCHLHLMEWRNGVQVNPATDFANL